MTTSNDWIQTCIPRCQVTATPTVSRPLPLAFNYVANTKFLVKVTKQQKHVECCSQCDQMLK